ncbi:MAG: DUF1684 domain-containing protein [Chloroflexota bacterium]
MTQVDEVLGHAAEDRYVRAIDAGRRAKDAFFRSSPDSPLRGAGGHPHALRYFAVDARYRIVVPRLRETPGTGPISLDTSTGERRTARRAGFLDFELNGQRLSLTGFRTSRTPASSLFVPFTDATSGSETYASGRYLDLEIDPDGSVVLDFNLAYHPYCAYSDAYSCPLAPAANRLPVPILAGERLIGRGHRAETS